MVVWAVSEFTDHFYYEISQVKILPVFVVHSKPLEIAQNTLKKLGQNCSKTTGSNDLGPGQKCF